MGFFKRDGKTRPITPKKVRDISDNDDGVQVNITIDNADELEEFAREKSEQDLKDESEWFEGDVYLGSDFTADELAEIVKKYEVGVRKPTALRTKKINGKTYSQLYYKPISPDEFTD